MKQTHQQEVFRTSPAPLPPPHQETQDLLALGSHSVLWLSIQLPSISLEVFTRGNALEQACVVSDGHQNTPRILAANNAAKNAGMFVGMSIKAASALAEDLQVCVRSIEREEKLLQHLAAWAYQFTSMVNIVPGQGLVLEVTGSLKLFSGLQSLFDRVCQGLEKLGYDACCAVAPTPAGAMLLAQAGLPETITHVQALKAQFIRIPLSALPLPIEKQTLLRGMGLRRASDVLRLPREVIARRLGPDFVLLLDRLLGKSADPRTAFEPKAHFEEMLLLPEEVRSTQRLMFAAKRLLLELTGVLQGCCSGVQQLKWQFIPYRGEAQSIEINLLEANRDIDHLELLVEEHFSRTRLDQPVIELGLLVDDMAPLMGSNGDLLPDKNIVRTRDAALFVERLRARLGDAAIGGVCLVSEHRPERAWRREYIKPVRSQPERHQGNSFGFSIRRPLWLLNDSIPLAEKDGQPLLEGPLAFEGKGERVESSWWDGKDAARDYFTVRNKLGARLWVYKERRGKRRWFLQGVHG